LEVVRRAPQLFGFTQSRWTLAALAQACPWLRATTLSGLWQLLKRLGIRYKRGREYLHSPDRCYEAKVSLIQHCLLQAWYEPERYVLLYEDELTYYQQPTLARDYEGRGHAQPLARWSHQPNRWYRIVAALNAVTGQVIYRQRSKITLEELSDFYADVRAHYPTAQQIYIVQDNWPVHFHPDVLARLQPQDFFPERPRVPDNWPTKPGAKVVRDALPIRLLLLPTYAPWLNPIEKLWRWLKQHVLHLHRMSDDRLALRQAVGAFLDQFDHESPELLRYVGLLPN
jgi:hypothetical protein